MFKIEYFNYFLPLNLRNVYQGNDYFEIIFKTQVFFCLCGKRSYTQSLTYTRLCFTTEIYTQPQNKVSLSNIEYTRPILIFSRMLTQSGIYVTYINKTSGHPWHFFADWAVNTKVQCGMQLSLNGSCSFHGLPRLLPCYTDVSASMLHGCVTWMCPLSTCFCACKIRTKIFTSAEIKRRIPITRPGMTIITFSLCHQITSAV